MQWWGNYASKKVLFFPHDILFLDLEKKAWAMSLKLDIYYAPGKEAEETIDPMSGFIAHEHRLQFIIKWKPNH